MTIYVCAFASLAFLRAAIWQFYLTCFVLGLVGNGAAHLAYSRSISTWFYQRLGTALAVVILGAGFGAMILLVIAQAVISQSGWRASYATLAGLALLLGLPLSWRYIRDRGEIKIISPYRNIRVQTLSSFVSSPEIRRRSSSSTSKVRASRC